MMCSKCSPLLSSAIPAYETFTLQWQSLLSSPQHPQIGAFVLEGLLTALKYHKLMHDNKIYIYAMCKWYIYFGHMYDSSIPCMKVVDLCICFLWIQRHWQGEIAAAKSCILDKVSTLVLHSYSYSPKKLQSNRSPQICQYQVTMDLRSNPGLAGTPSSTQPHAFMTLAAWYGLPNLQISPQDEGLQSVKEEFSSYIMTTSHAKMDPLAFWGVSN